MTCKAPAPLGRVAQSMHHDCLNTQPCLRSHAHSRWISHLVDAASGYIILSNAFSGFVDQSVLTHVRISEAKAAGTRDSGQEYATLTCMSVNLYLSLASRIHPYQSY